MITILLVHSFLTATDTVKTTVTDSKDKKKMTKLKGKETRSTIPLECTTLGWEGFLQRILLK